MAPDVAVAESSTASLSSMTEQQRSTWLKTGDLPEAPKETPKSVEPSEKADSQTAPESKTDAASSPAEPKANAESRIKELLSEIKAKDAEIDRLRQSPTAKAKVIEVPARP